MSIDRLGTIPALRGTETPKAEPPRGVYCLRLMALTLLGLIFGIYPVNQYSYAATKSNDPKELQLYAYNQMNWSDFECYNWLIHKESRWNPKAINGSHYGLGQMRNKKVKYLNGYQQIDWHLRYINHRYDGKPCKALHHLEKYGWH